MKKNRTAAFGRPHKGGGRPSAARPLCVSIVLHFVVASVDASVVAAVVAAVVDAVVAAVGFASLSALAGTASSGLALRLSTSAGCVSAVTDAAAAGPMADADADDSWHLPPVFVHVEDLCCEPLFVENLSFHFSTHGFRENMQILLSVVGVPPSGLY